MRVVVQRVSRASVSVDSREISKIGKGLFVLVGVKAGDTEKEADFLAEKLSKLRVMSFDSDPRLSSSERPRDKSNKKINFTVSGVKGEFLVVSQFTLYANTSGGNRPSFLESARPEVAEPLYEYFIKKLKSYGVSVQVGKFGAMMEINVVLDGPVTIIFKQ